MNTLETMIAAATAHRACCGTEHDAPNGKLHGYCVVCGVEWPCETARAFIFESRPPYPYLAVCQDLAQILQAPLPSDGGPGDLGDLVEAIRDRMASLEDRAACLKDTLEENRRLKDLLEARTNQLGVACLKHDLTHALACGDCLKEAEARVRELEERLSIATQNLQTTNEEAQRMCDRLAAIDAACEGEPEPPSGEGVTGKVAALQLYAWGRQGWDAAAALRVELDKSRAQEREHCIQAAWTWAKEGPCSLLNQDGLRAAVEGRKGDADAHPSF